MSKAPFTDNTLRQSLVINAFRSTGVVLELLDYKVARPVHGVVQRSQKWTLNVSLGPRLRADGQLAKRPGQRLCEVGNLLIMGPQVDAHFVCYPGHVRTLTCTLREDHVTDLLASNYYTPLALDASEFDLSSEGCTGYMNTIANELLIEQFGRIPMMRSLAEVAFIEAYRSIGRVLHPSKTGGLAAWQLDRIFGRVLDDLGDPPTITELAQACRISSRHLIREFKKSTGTTVGRLVRTAQVNKAKSLLASTDLQIEAISSQLGFSRAANFSTAFKRATGSTPQRFRQRSTH